MDDNEKRLAEEISKEVLAGIKGKTAKFGTLKNIVEIVLKLVPLVILILIVLSITNVIGNNSDTVKPVEDHDLTIENNGIFGYTAVDFENAILGQAQKKSLLIVDEQEVSIVSETTKAGLFNWSIFSKTQSITYYGIAQFIVDVMDMNKDDILVDDISHTITIKVNKPELHDIIINHEKTVFSDTEKGLLAFGDIEMTQEESNSIIVEATKRLKERASEKDCVDKANQYAKYVLRDLFETSISDVTDSYKIKVEFKEK